jgi:sporulation protein YlmC with PRC-barrel domain
MNVRWTVSLAAGMAVLLWGAFLAIAAEPNIGQNQPAMQDAAGIIQNSTLVGATVIDRQGQKLGQIRNVLLDAQAGQATFVVIDAKAPGTGQAMLVVPYQALRVSFNTADNRQSVVLDLGPNQVGAAPQIQNNQWQMLQNTQFLQQARNFYQTRTYTAARPIDANPSAPIMPGPAPLIQYLVPQPPCWNHDSGWTHEMEEFSQE